MRTPGMGWGTIAGIIIGCCPGGCCCNWGGGIIPGTAAATGAATAATVVAAAVDVGAAGATAPCCGWGAAALGAAAATTPAAGATPGASGQAAAGGWCAIGVAGTAVTATGPDRTVNVGGGAAGTVAEAAAAPGSSWGKKAESGGDPSMTIGGRAGGDAACGWNMFCPTASASGSRCRGCHAIPADSSRSLVASAGGGGPCSLSPISSMRAPTHARPTLMCSFSCAESPRRCVFWPKAAGPLCSPPPTGSARHTRRAPPPPLSCGLPPTHKRLLQGW